MEGSLERLEALRRKPLENLEVLKQERDELEEECRQLKEQLANQHELEKECRQLKEQLVNQQIETTAPTLELPEPAILLNQLKSKHPKSKASLKDVEEILALVSRLTV